MPLIFIALWVVGMFGLPLLELGGPLFLAYEAILTIILLLVERFRTAI